MDTTDHLAARDTIYNRALMQKLVICALGIAAKTRNKHITLDVRANKLELFARF